MAQRLTGKDRDPADPRQKGQDLRPDTRKEAGHLCHAPR